MTKKQLKGEFREPLAEKAEALEGRSTRLRERLNSPWIRIIGFLSLGLVGLGVAILLNLKFNAGVVLVATGGLATMATNAFFQKWRKDFDATQAEKAELQQAIENSFRERELSLKEKEVFLSEDLARLRAIEVFSTLLKSASSREDKDFYRGEIKRLMSSDEGDK